MIVQFRYKLPENLIPLVCKEVIDFNDDHILGWIDQMDAAQLKHCSMYMICELEEYNDLTVLRNPVGVVARNDIQALQIYNNTVTEKVNGTVLCEIINNCKDIKVEPTGVCI